MATRAKQIEHDEAACADCLESALFASRSTVETLATALRDCVQSLERLPDVEGAYRVTVIQQAKAALRSLDSEHDETACDECGHQSNPGDETHYPECSRINVS